MQERDPLAVVHAWVAAANAQDAERLLACSDPTIEVVGPRGSGFGHQLLRNWLARAGLRLETLRAFVREDVVVLEQRGVWRSLETGEMTSEKALATFFEVHGGHVVKFARFDGIEEAFATTGLEPADAVPQPGHP